MLRRAKKRSATSVDNAKPTFQQRQVKEREILGSKPSKDEEEEVLESLVIGSDSDLLANLEVGSSHDGSASKIKRESEKPTPAWEDEDDDEKSTIKISTKELRHQYFKHEKNKEISSTKYRETLKSQFEKLSGTPKWAQLKWEKDEEDDDEGSDAEGQELLQTTGNYTTGSQSLPRGTIDMKQCANANREEPLKGKAKNVEFHPNAQVILTAGMCQTLSLFQVDGKKNPKIQSVFLDKFPIHTAHFTRDGREVVCGSKHKSFYYYDMIAGKIVKVPQLKGSEDNNTKRFVMSPDGEHILFLGNYGRMNLVTAKSKELITTLKMNGSVESAAFSPDGSQLYSLGDDGEVYVWDMRTRDCIHRFTDDGCIKGNCIASSNNGQYIATGCQSGVVNIYDQSCLSEKRPTPMKAVLNLTSPCTSLRFNPTTEILSIASDFTENSVKFVHIPSFTVFSNFPDKTDKFRIPFCTDFSPHGGYFTVGNNKGEALLYRVKHYGNY